MTGKNFKLLDTGWRNNRTEAYFRYEINTDEENFELEELLKFPQSIPESYESESLLRALHIALAISYYKAFIPPEIKHPYKMTEVEATFWNTVYLHGLGEFLFNNNLKGDVLAKYSAQDGIKNTNENNVEFANSALLGIGGGKDSIVAGELLKEAGLETKGFVLATGEQLGQTQAVANEMNVELLQVNRQIDLKILDINKLPGAYNGHIPISLIFGLIGAMLAVGSNSKYVVVANESSASIPQAKLGELEINHQWSKSIEFERLFQDYLHAYVSEELSYFSAVRSLSSVSIAKIFSNYPQYFEVFTSDNSLFKINQAEREHPRWSKNSSKTLSSYILFAPWLEKSALNRIFGYDYLDDIAFEQRVVDLLGGGNPVLDCVGTPEELKASLAEAIKQGKFSNSGLLANEKIANLINNAKPLENYLELSEDSIPATLKETIHKNIKDRL